MLLRKLKNNSKIVRHIVKCNCLSELRSLADEKKNLIICDEVNPHSQQPSQFENTNSKIASIFKLTRISIASLGLFSFSLCYTGFFIQLINSITIWTVLYGELKFHSQNGGRIVKCQVHSRIAIFRQRKNETIQIDVTICILIRDDPASLETLIETSLQFFNLL